MTTLQSYMTVALHCGNLSFGWHCVLVMSQPVALLIAFPWPLLTVALHHSCLTFHCRQYCTMAMLIFYLLWHCTSPICLMTTAHHDGYASISTKRDLVPQSCPSLPCLQHIPLLQSPLYALNQMPGPAFSTIRNGIYIIRCQYQQETWKIPNLWTGA